MTSHFRDTFATFSTRISGSVEKFTVEWIFGMMSAYKHQMNEPSKGTVLVVDDEEQMRAILTTVIRNAGFAVFAAKSTTEASEILKREEISIVLLDWNLKGSGTSEGTTGASVIHASRKTDPTMPVIVISGATEMDVRTDAVMEQADSFMAKPFSMSVLLAHVSRLVERHRASKQLLHLNCPEQILPLDEVKNRYIKKAVAVCEGNITLAAAKLGVHRHTVMSAINKEPPLTTVNKNDT
jgi:DNA-binding NtrC family response regulator